MRTAESATTTTAPANGGSEQKEQSSWTRLADGGNVIIGEANNVSTMLDVVVDNRKVDQENLGGFSSSSSKPVSMAAQLLNEMSSMNATLVAREIDNGGDEEEYLEILVGDLSFKDDKYKDSLLARLNTLRRNREMCDVVLLVGQREIYAHKAVLAAVSPTLFDLLSPSSGGSQQQQQQAPREESPTLFTTTAPSSQGASPLTNGHHHHQVGGKEKNQKNGEQQQSTTLNEASPSVYLEFSDVDFDCFDALIDYAYSGSLEISSKKVADLYKTASRFRMQSCAEACAKYLVKQLNPHNCIGVRKCANRANDFLLASKVDGYIQKNFSEITQKSKEFLALPFVQIEVVLCVDGRPEIAGPMKEERRLGDKVIDWLQQQVHDLPEHAVFRMEMLTQKVHLLYLDEELILQDCRDMDEATIICSSDMIQDYKKSSRRNVSQAAASGKTKNKPGSQVAASPGPKIARFASTDSMNSLASEHDEVEWKIIAVVRSSENYYSALAVVRRQLAVLSIRLVDSTTLTTRGGDDVETIAAYAVQQSTRQADLAVMATPRCSVGAVSLDGKVFVCGGYDRGECLRSVEQYDPVANRWTAVPPMNKERGRFDAAVLDDKVYAVGGSDGARDLQCAESYDPKTGKWTRIAHMHNPRSNHGVTTANGFVYAIGGCQGQKPVKQCERYDAATNTWEHVASLQHARYQAGCCAWSDQLIVVSGCDTWNCINSVECFDSTTNVWRFLPSLQTARRGCGVGVLQGKLYAFGGSDGVQSLCSVEVLDLADSQATWKPGPSLNCPRGNVRAVVLNTVAKGDVLFAIGGFNGKSFLNSIEYLEEGATEWKTTMLKIASTDLSALSAILTNVAHNHQSSLNQAKFVIDEDLIGESQNEAPVLSTEVQKPDQDSNNA